MKKRVLWSIFLLIVGVCAAIYLCMLGVWKVAMILFIQYIIFICLFVYNKI